MGGSSAASVAYLILAVFLGGVALGVVAMAAVAVREDRPYFLSGMVPGAAARGARWLTCFGGAGSRYRPRGWA
jgi:hypothetical protein